MRRFLFFIAVFLCFHCSAQDLTGIWRGHFESEQGARTMQIPGLEDRYKFEVQLDQTDKSFKGVTYSYKTTVFYGKASCYGAINYSTKKVFLEETRILEMKSAGGGACIMTCFLQYSKVGEEEVLEGHYTSMSTQDSSQCGKGTIYLRKVETSDFYKEPFLTDKEKPKQDVTKIKPLQPPPPKTQPQASQHDAKKAPSKTAAPPPPVKPSQKNNRPADKNNSTAQVNKPRPAAPNPAKTKMPEVVTPKKLDEPKSIPDDSVKKMTGKSSNIAVPQVLATRENELVKTIATSARNITIKIYDNGTIDNDTVTVYVDKKLVVSKARLTEKAIVVNLTLDENVNTHELVMVADNLGEIPPNTSLMVVTAGDQQYEVRIASTEQKNAVVRFRYEPGQ